MKTEETSNLLEMQGTQETIYGVLRRHGMGDRLVRLDQLLHLWHGFVDGEIPPRDAMSKNTVHHELKFPLKRLRKLWKAVERS